jgi:hypothetical protein
MAAKNSRNPAQKSSRVSRAPGMPKVKAPGKTAPPPMNAAADRQENLRRGAGPTRVGDATPVPPKGRRSTAPDLPPGVRDLSSHTTGVSIVQRANSRANRPGRGGN